MDKWKIFSDEELQKLKWDAQEMQDIKWIKAINDELNRRCREE